MLFRSVTGYNVQNNSIGPEKLTDRAKTEMIQQAVDLMPEYANPGGGVKIKETTFTISSIAAGTIGTRGTNQNKNLSDVLGTYTEVLGCYVSSVGGSTAYYIPVPFIYNSKIYLNCYRATDSAISQFSVDVTIVYR